MKKTIISGIMAVTFAAMALAGCDGKYAGAGR